MPGRRQRGGILAVRVHSTKRKRPSTHYINITCGATPVTTPDIIEVCSSTVHDDSSAPKSSSSRPTKYADNIREIANEWAAVREKLVTAANDMEEPTSFVCCMCHLHVESPVRCRDCYPSYVACEQCSIEFHQHLLHKPEVWNVCQFCQPYHVLYTNI